MLATVRKTVLCAGAAVVVVALCTPSPAEAAFKLQLCSAVAGSCVEIEDQEAGVDSNGNVGAITWIGSIGNFTINVSTGLSKPVFPSSASLSRMDLNSVNTSTGADELLIFLTDTDFAGSLPGALRGEVGGTTNGTVDFAACKDPGNTEYSTECQETEPTIFLGPFEDGAFSDAATEPHGALGPYSMTLIAHIVHGSGVQSTSFDFEVSNIAEPATLALFGLGLIGVGTKIVRRRQRR